MAQVAIVGHDEQGRRPVGPIEQPDVVDEADDDRVTRPRAAVAHGQPGRDPFVAQAALGGTVEHELDGDRRPGWRLVAGR